MVHIVVVELCVLCMSLPILYTFRRCPYAMRARLAVLSSGLQCELREVILRNKPPALLTASPKGTVPVLITASGEVLEESLDIMRWALEQSDPSDYWPKKDDLRSLSLVLIERNDGQFKRALDRYKYPDRYQHEADFDNAADYAMKYRRLGAQILEDLNQRIAGQGYLLGEQASLVDLALMPFVRQFAHTDKAWFAEQNWPALHQWLQQWLDSALMQSVMNKYTPWEKGEAPVLFGG